MREERGLEAMLSRWWFLLWRSAASRDCCGRDMSPMNGCGGGGLDMSTADENPIRVSIFLIVFD
jgi:hypothetical protein